MESNDNNDNPFNTQESYFDSMPREVENIDTILDEIDNSSDVEENLESIEDWVIESASFLCCQKHCLFELNEPLRQFKNNYNSWNKERRKTFMKTVLYCCRRKNRSNENGREVLKYTFYPFEDICVAAFCRLFTINHRSLKRWLANFKVDGLKLKEHGNKNRAPAHALSEETKANVKNWIIDYGRREGEDRPGRWRENGLLRDTDSVLPAHLTIQSIYSLFLSDNIARISYNTFRRFFAALPIRIQAPKSDICDECTQLKMKIMQSTAEDVLQQLNLDLRNHIQEARYAREEYLIDSRIEEYTHISFDYAQNLWLPHLANQPSTFFFASLLNVCLFGILNEKSNIQQNYIYHEGQGKKGSNNVVSMLVDYLFKLKPEQRQKIIIHCDNCTGQNKNNCMIKYLCWMVMKGYSQEIQLKFMVRGHTKFQVDSHFGMIKKKFQTIDCYNMQQVEDLINDSSEFNQTIQFPSRRFKEYREPLDLIFNDLKGVSNCQCFWFNSEWLGSVKTRRTVTGEFTVSRLLKPGVSDYSMTPTPLSVPGLQFRKQEGMYTKVRPFIPDEFKESLCPYPVAPPNAPLPEIPAIQQDASPTAASTTPRRRRLATEIELEKLLALYEANQNPSKIELEQLANELAWDLTRLRSWFTNKRRRV